MAGDGMNKVARIFFSASSNAPSSDPANAEAKTRPPVDLDVIIPSGPEIDAIQEKRSKFSRQWFCQHSKELMLVPAADIDDTFADDDDDSPLKTVRDSKTGATTSWNNAISKLRPNRDATSTLWSSSLVGSITKEGFASGGTISHQMSIPINADSTMCAVTLPRGESHNAPTHADKSFSPCETDR